MSCLTVTLPPGSWLLYQRLLLLTPNRSKGLGPHESWGYGQEANPLGTWLEAQGGPVGSWSGGGGGGRGRAAVELPALRLQLLQPVQHHLLGGSLRSTSVNQYGPVPLAWHWL